MQYYNKFSENNGIHNTDKVVCLNRVLTICTEKANALFSCKVDFICPAELTYVGENSRSIIEDYCTLLDKYCSLYSEITVKLERNAGKDTATLTVCDSEDNHLHRLDFELYTDIPGLVIRAPEEDAVIFKAVEDIFEKLEYISRYK